MSRDPGLGIEYEVLVPAYFSLRLLCNPEVENFTLSINVANFGNFDDLIIHLKLRNGDIQKFAFQLKHAKREEKHILPAHFTVSKDFQLKKYLDGFNTIEKWNEFRFILFTNRRFDASKMDDVENFKMRKFETCPGRKFFDTSGYSGNSVQIFKFDAKSDFKVYREFLQNFSFYSGQQNFRSLEEAIITFLQCEYNLDSYSATNYINFFRHWQKKEFSSNVLKKEEITIQLIDLSIQHFQVIPAVDNANSHLMLLGQVVQKFNITIIEDSAQFPETWTLPLEEYMKYPLSLGKQYKIVQKFIKELTSEMKHKILSYCCRHPLVVHFNYKSQSKIISAIKKCLEQNIDVKWILLCSSKLRNINGCFPKCKIFSNLWDLFDTDPGLYKRLTEAYHISPPVGPPISLTELIDNDEEVRRSVTVKQLFEMATGKAIFRNDRQFTLECYVPRKVSKISVDIKIINNLEQDFIILDCNEFYDHILSKIERDFVSFEDIGHECQSLLSLNKENTSEDQFTLICAKVRSGNIHHLKAVGSETFEWLRTKGSIAELQNSDLKRYVVNEKEICVNNKVTIVCGNPGLGKSTLLKQLTNRLVHKFWTIFADLKQHSTFLSTNYTVQELLDYFMAVPDKTLLGKVKEIFLKRKLICLLLDGLDELGDMCVEKLLDSINQIVALGVRVWVSSRFNMKEKLETKLNSFSVDMENLDIQDQETYIREILQGQYSIEETNQLVGKNFCNVHLDSELLGIPLHLSMITEMLLYNQQFPTDNLFVLSKLYKHFFEAKYSHYIDKIMCKLPHFLENEWQQRLENYKVAALQVCLDEDIFLSLSINCNEFLRRIGKENDPVGVILKVVDDQAVFEHYSYAEYFAAVWLADNSHKVPNLGNFLFDKKYDHIRLIFDVKLAEDSPAHLAVISGDFHQLTLHTLKFMDQKDGAGRNLLHIAGSYGQRFPRLETNENCTISDQEANITHKETEHRREILDFLLDFQWNFFEKDALFGFDAFIYADRTLHLYAIEQIMAKITPAVECFRNYADIPTLLYYSAQFGFSNVLKVAMLIEESRRRGFLRNSLYCIMTYFSNITNTRKECLLHMAVKNNHLNIVRTLLEKGYNINATDRNNWTPLHFAANNGFAGIATALVEVGANVKAIDFNGMTPLRCAISGGHLAIVELLLDHGASIADVHNPLHLAVMKGDLDIAVFLLEMGVNANSLDAFGRSPFYWSITEGYAFIAMLLLGKGADINLPDKTGITPLHWTCHKADYKLMEFLLKTGADVNVRTNNGSTPLHLAVVSDNINMVNLLTQNNAGLDLVDKYYERSPLHYSAYNGHVEITKILLDVNANSNITDVDHSLPLHLAVLNGHKEIVELLTAVGTDINAGTCNGKTPLHIAVEQNYYDIGLFLLQRGANVNVLDKFKGQSPLHLAIDSGNKQMVVLLLDNGADINAADLHKQSPLDLALHYEYVDVINLMIEKAIEVNCLNP